MGYQQAKQSILVQLVITLKDLHAILCKAFVSFSTGAVKGASSKRMTGVR